MINLELLARQKLETQPYGWAFVNDLFAEQDKLALAASFPSDHFKTVDGYDGEKGYRYEARSLVAMGAHRASYAEALSEAWQRLASDLISAEYKEAMSRLTGIDLSGEVLEVNVFHYGPGAWLGPHVDLKEKLVTHVFYFNEEWRLADGGCFRVLASSNMNDLAAEVLPLAGNSSVIVRSDHSWHAVSKVPEGCRLSRRSITVTFYPPGTISTMWPPAEVPILHDYSSQEKSKTKAETAGLGRLRKRLFRGR